MLNSSLTKSTAIRLSWWKYLANMIIFQIPFSQWRGSLTKKLFWAFFQNTTKTICLQNFNVVSHPVQVFCWWMIHLWQIFGGNIFLVIFLRFCTSQKWNYQILIKIEQDLGHYFSKFLKSLIVLYSCIVHWQKKTHRMSTVRQRPWKQLIVRKVKTWRRGQEEKGREVFRENKVVNSK